MANLVFSVGHRKNDQAQLLPTAYPDSEMSVTGKALWYIESHLRSDVSLAIVADAIDVSTFHLSRAFGVSLGLSFATYLRRRRLSEAAKLLAQGGSGHIGGRARCRLWLA